jgi:hypothetical protein
MRAVPILDSHWPVCERFDRLAPIVGPIPPHLRGRTIPERYLAAVDDSKADARRRREFDDGDPVAW